MRLRNSFCWYQIPSFVSISTSNTAWNGTSNLGSTKACPQPHGSPCINTLDCSAFQGAAMPPSGGGATTAGDATPYRHLQAATLATRRGATDSRASAASRQKCWVSSSRWCYQVCSCEGLSALPFLTRNHLVVSKKNYFLPLLLLFQLLLIAHSMHMPILRYSISYLVLLAAEHRCFR